MTPAPPPELWIVLRLLIAFVNVAVLGLGISQVFRRRWLRRVEWGYITSAALNGSFGQVTLLLAPPSARTVLSAVTALVGIGLLVVALRGRSDDGVILRQMSADLEDAIARRRELEAEVAMLRRSSL